MDRPEMSTDASESGASIRAFGLEQTWGPCRDDSSCWRKIEVRSDRRLTLSDAEGQETHSITEAEFADLWAAIESDEFRATVEDTTSRRCGDPVFDGTATWIIEQVDDELTQVTNVGSCSRDEGHPYRDVLLQMVNLRIVYHPCPSFSYPPGFVVGVDEPPVRPMCVACTGLC